MFEANNYVDNLTRPDVLLDSNTITAVPQRRKRSPHHLLRRRKRNERTEAFRLIADQQLLSAGTVGQGGKVK